MAWKMVPPDERDHFNKDGSAKRAFDTIEDAERLARHLTPRAYLCLRCGKYHVGKRKKESA